ncbi:hypothetical protein Vi05172_g5410 [Venturia inaequalis]|nr:hypothetical protein Vi05172_g5410 [Venturia inaequalis]
MSADTEVPDSYSSITLREPADPDAQATVHDFLDYTEYFPSDLYRSLTLIGKLDTNYREAAQKVHDLTVLYADLPKLDASERPDPVDLRVQISTALNKAISYREAAYAEAVRLQDISQRHSSRVSVIIKKLKELPKPPSRDPTPVPLSPQALRAAKKTEPEKTPRLTLHVAGGRAPRHRQILVPGSVLPPLGPEDENWTESEDEVVADLSDIGTEQASRNRKSGAARIRVQKTPKPRDRSQKTPNPLKIRTPGQFGTNVHSQVAGISTSNALALLTPPPQDAKPGSKWMPWFKLTEYEMAKLRKQMKKNAIWTPSDTMIRRVLASTNRGRENYEKTKQQCEENGEPFIDEDPVDPTKKVLGPGEVSMDLSPGQTEDLINRGMRLNEAKKQKKAEKALAEAMELEEANKQLATINSSFANLFDKKHSTPLPESLKMGAPVSTQKKDNRAAARKRKRESDKETASVDTPAVASSSQDMVQPGPKKLKINHPIAPKPVPAKKPSPVKTATFTTTTTVPLLPPAPSPRKKQPTPAPIPAPVVEIKKVSPPMPVLVQPTAAQTRARRSSVGPKATPETADEAETTAKEKQKENEPPNEREMRPRSSHSAVVAGKAASAEPPSKRNEGRELREKRRASVVEANSITSSIPEPVQPRTTRAGRRQAPGLVTADEDGKGKVGISKRKAAPRKRGSTSNAAMDDKMKKEDVGDMDEPIDPNEERYCICGDVSWGTMVACENEECEKEWFHLGCVGLEEIPGRRVKWWCPECRVKLGLDDTKKGVKDEPGRRR